MNEGTGEIISVQFGGTSGTLTDDIGGGTRIFKNYGINIAPGVKVAFRSITINNPNGDEVINILTRRLPN